MEYTVEDVSPVRKKVNVKVAPEEVEAAIKAAVALFRQGIQLDGFRKGKAPVPVVEKRFHDEIYKEARENLVNVHINEVLENTGTSPVSPIEIEGGEKPLKKGEAFEYEMSYDVMPVFELPNYEGLEVEEEKIMPSDAMVEHMLKRMQRERSKLEPVNGDGPARDGQIANIDFETILDGKALDNFRATAFDLDLNEKAALPEFQEFVKTIPVGHTAEKAIHFPDDFIAPELAGKEPLMKVTVHAVKERILPELDDKFAEQLGQKDMETVRKNLAESYAMGMKTLQKGVAQRKLLDALVKQTDFELPQGMVDMNVNLLIGDIIGRAESEGRSILKDAGDLEKLKSDVRADAESRTREKVLLLAIAQKENLEVSNQEVEREVYRGALKMGRDPQAYYDNMRETGMIFQLRDSMLTDKAMDLIYERANVKLVEPEQETPESEATEETAKDPQPE